MKEKKEGDIELINRVISTQIVPGWLLNQQNGLFTKEISSLKTRGIFGKIKTPLFLPLLKNDLKSFQADLW